MQMSGVRKILTGHSRAVLECPRVGAIYYFNRKIPTTVARIDNNKVKTILVFTTKMLALYLLALLFWLDSSSEYTLGIR